MLRQALATPTIDEGDEGMIITLANFKGGAGKSTLAAVLAQTIARDRRVTLCDCDPNEGFIRFRERRQAAGLVMPFAIEAVRDPARLASLLAARPGDVFIIDTEGRRSDLVAQALTSAHLVLIPMNRSPEDARCAAAVVEEIDRLERENDFAIELAISLSAVSHLATTTEQEIGKSVQATAPTLEAMLSLRDPFRAILRGAKTLYELREEHAQGLASTTGPERARHKAQLEKFDKAIAEAKAITAEVAARAQAVADAEKEEV